MPVPWALFTLRYAAEVRPATAYFEDLADPPVDEDQVALAQKLSSLSISRPR